MQTENNGKANQGKPRPHWLAFLLSLFFSLLSVIQQPVYAQDVNFADIPTRLGEALGIGTFAGQMLMSSCFILMFLLPIAMLTRKGRGSWIPEVTVSFVALGACIAFGWLPYWFLIIIAMFTALMFSGTMRDLITGKGK